MLDENNNLEVETSEPHPEEKGNRTFWLIGGIFGGLIVLTLICMAVWFLWASPRIEAAQVSQEETAEAQRVQQAQAMTATAEAVVIPPTSQPTPTVTKTLTKTVPAATQTPVVVLATPQESPQPTATVNQTQLSARMTQTSAGAGQSTQSSGATPLPTTGFFDDVGLPLLIVLTCALIAVIFITRRMRKLPSE